MPSRRTSPYLFLIPLSLLLAADAAGQISAPSIQPNSDPRVANNERGHGRPRDPRTAYNALDDLLNVGKKALKADPPDHTLARWAFAEAMRINPKEVRAYEGLGEVYTALRRYSRAVYVYSEALKLKPKKAELHFQLGALFQKLGDKAAAREKLQLLREMKKKELAAKLEAQLSAPPER